MSEGEKVHVEFGILPSGERFFVCKIPSRGQEMVAFGVKGEELLTFFAALKRLIEGEDSPGYVQ